MWNLLLERSTLIVDPDRCFYVGDAAGRSRDWSPGYKADHSLADRLFALNLNVKFYTPEEYCANLRCSKYAKPEFEPRHLVPYDLPRLSQGVQVIVMVGSPASGKSHYCANQLAPANFAHTSRDARGTWQKCVEDLDACLKMGRKVVVDNTNPDKVSRARYLAVAKQHNVPCRCFVMDVGVKHALHNNRFRLMTGQKHAVIGEPIIYSYFKNFQQPDESEGFDEIVKVPFVPRFDNPDEEQLYGMYLLEK